MAILTNAQLKALWVTGFKPTQADFDDLFDSIKSGIPEIFNLNAFSDVTFSLDFSQRIPQYVSASGINCKSVRFDDLSQLQSLLFSSNSLVDVCNIDLSSAGQLIMLDGSGNTNVNFFGFSYLYSLTTLRLYQVTLNGALLTGINHIEASNLLTTVDLSGNAFTQGAVDNVLEDLVNLAAHDGNCDLSGASMASPSSVGLAAKAVLVSRGWTVATS